MRYVISAVLMGAIVLGAAPALAHDHDDWDDHDRDRSSQHYRAPYGYGPPPTYYKPVYKPLPPPVYYRPVPQPVWIEPVRYKFQPQENYLIISWFRGHPTYYPQPLYLSNKVHDKLRPRYGPVYQPYALPVDLDRRLEPVPYGFQRIFVNNQILLVDVQTGNIHDVIYL